MPERHVPSVGRIVHYLARFTDGAIEPCPAIVTAVATPGDPESDLSLVVFSVSGLTFLIHIPFGEDAGHWHWPPFVPPVKAE